MSFFSPFEFRAAEKGVVRIGRVEDNPFVALASRAWSKLCNRKGTIDWLRKAPIFPDIPGFNEDSGKMSCVWRWVGFGWPHDSRRLSYRRGSQSADRAGSRRFGCRSRDKARQRPGAVG